MTLVQASESHCPLSSQALTAFIILSLSFLDFQAHFVCVCVCVCGFFFSFLFFPPPLSLSHHFPVNILQIVLCTL